MRHFGRHFGSIGFGLSGGVALLIVAGASLPALAGSFDPTTSTIEIQIGSGPRVVIPATGSGVTLSNLGQGHSVALTGAAFTATSVGPSTSLFVGLPLVSSIRVISLSNGIGTTFADNDAIVTPFGNASVSGFGGVGSPVQGLAVVTFPTGPSVTIPLSVAGPANRGTALCGTATGQICTAGRFHTAPVVITGIQSPRVSVQGRGPGVLLTLNPTAAEVVRVFSTGGNFTSTGVGDVDFVSTVTVSGANNLVSASQAGGLTLVAPIRIDTQGSAGVLPGQIRMNLNFVPEPETLLLQLSAAAGLLLIGRWKSRQR